MSDLAAVFLACFLGGVALPVGALAVAGDIHGAGKSHAYKVEQAEKRGADRINGRISVIIARSANY